MKKILITFLGRNEKSIRNDAIELFGEFDEYIVVARNSDRMLKERPDAIELDEALRKICHLGISSLPDDEDDEYGEEITVIVNGGTSAQLVPVLLKLTQTCVDYQYLDCSYGCDASYSPYLAKIIEIDRDKKVIEYN